MTRHLQIPSAGCEKVDTGFSQESRAIIKTDHGYEFGLTQSKLIVIYLSHTWAVDLSNK